MTNQMPSNSPSPKDERQDELIAALVALGAIGTVFFWGLHRGGDGSKIVNIVNTDNLFPIITTDDSNGSTSLEQLAQNSEGGSSVGGVPDDSLVCETIRIGEKKPVEPNLLFSLGDKTVEYRRVCGTPEDLVGIGGSISGSRSTATDTTGEINSTNAKVAAATRASEAITTAISETLGISETETVNATETETQLEDTAAELEKSDTTVVETTTEPQPETAVEDTTDLETIESETVVEAEAESEAIATTVVESEAENEAIADAEAEDEAVVEEIEVEEIAQLSEEVPVEQFSDVEVNYWATPFIDGLRQKDVATGFIDGSFGPDTPISRSQFAAQIYRAFSQGGGSRELDYSDVSTNHPQYEAIGQVTKSGFMSGYPKGDFKPNNDVSRLEVLLALASGLNLPVPRDPESILQTYYQDVDQIPSWAVPKIAAATEAGMVVNYSDITILDHAQPATRAEAAAMLYQALVSSGKAPEVTSEYIVQPQ